MVFFFLDVDKDTIFEIDDTRRTQNTCIKLNCRQVSLDCTKFFFSSLVKREGNKRKPLGPVRHDGFTFKQLDRRAAFNLTFPGDAQILAAF